MSTLSSQRQSRSPCAGSQTRQGGFSLIVSLLLLIAVTLLGISMFRGLGLQEKIAGNTREKQRSFQAAQSALQFGEWWLSQNGAGTGSTCTGVVSASTLSNMKVCSNPLLTPTTLPWANRFEFTPGSMTVLSGGGLATADANGVRDINYSAKPSVYIYYLGLGPDGTTMLYQVTAAGYGGTTNGATVVRSTYGLKSAFKSIDGL